MTKFVAVWWCHFIIESSLSLKMIFTAWTILLFIFFLYLVVTCAFALGLFFLSCYRIYYIYLIVIVIQIGYDFAIISYLFNMIVCVWINIFLALARSDVPLTVSVYTSHCDIGDCCGGWGRGGTIGIISIVGGNISSILVVVVNTFLHTSPKLFFAYR
jgi:hypothetical protein